MVFEQRCSYLPLLNGEEVFEFLGHFCREAVIADVTANCSDITTPNVSAICTDVEQSARSLFCCKQNPSFRIRSGADFGPLLFLWTRPMEGTCD